MSGKILETRGKRDEAEEMDGEGETPNCHGGSQGEGPISDIC